MMTSCQRKIIINMENINSELISSTIRSLYRCEEFINNKYPQIIIETEYLLLDNNIKKMSLLEINYLVQNYHNYQKKFKKLQEQDNKILNECINLILSKIDKKI